MPQADQAASKIRPLLGKIVPMLRTAIRHRNEGVQHTGLKALRLDTTPAMLMRPL